MMRLHKPSQFTNRIDSPIREGDKMKMTLTALRPSVAVVVAFGLVSSLIAGPALAQRYEVTDLGSEGTTSYATAMNNAGQVVGYAGDLQEALLWDGHGGVQELGVAGIPTSINDAGQVV